MKPKVGYKEDIQPRQTRETYLQSLEERVAEIEKDISKCTNVQVDILRTDIDYARRMMLKEFEQNHNTTLQQVATALAEGAVDNLCMNDFYELLHNLEVIGNLNKRMFYIAMRMI